MMERWFFVLLIGLSLISCRKNTAPGSYKQGVLEYKITYINAKEENYDPSFLPKRMVLEFTPTYTINLIDGFMGFFKLGNIMYFKNQKVRSHLKVLDKYYTSTSKKHEMMCCFDNMDGMILKEDTSTRIIAGLKSHKVAVTLKDSKEKFDVYYTDEINLTHPNATNPYSHIKGVLTEFRLKMGNYKMLFTAVKFDTTSVGDIELKDPDDAVRLDRREMEAILKRLMEQNM